MALLILAFFAIVDTLPKEFHIDCSSWSGAVAAEIDFRFVPVSGNRIETGFEIQPKTEPEDVRNVLERNLRDAGWRYRKIGKGIIILEGSKNSPIRSVEFTSKVWKPDVRVVFLPPYKK